jgi:hypothetical protein
MVDAKELAMRPKKPKPKGGTKEAPLHGKMRGLNNDDHSQYLTNSRGDKRYYTKTEVDIFFGGLSGDFYTNEVVDDLFAATKKSLTTLLKSKADQEHTHETEHNVGHLHDLLQTKADEDHAHHEIYSKMELEGGILDDRYYTQQEITTLLDKIEHALKDRSPVGHKHSKYYTKESLDSGQLNDLYFTRKELNLILAAKAESDHEHDDLVKSDYLVAGALDVRYYTKDDSDHLFDIASREIKKSIETHEHRSYCSKSELNKGLLDKKYYPKAEVNKLISEVLEEVGSKDHSHRNYLENKEFRNHLSKINAKMDGLAEYSHDHPEIINTLEDLYYTETEVNNIVKELNDSLIRIMDGVIEEGLLIKELVDLKADAKHDHKHKSMSGLVEDDHPQYLLASGDRELIEDWDVGPNKKIKTGCLKARSDDGLKLLNANDFGVVIEGDNHIGLGTEPVDGWPVTIPSNPGAQAGLLITDTQGNRAYIRSSEAGVWLGALSDNKVLFTVGGTASDNVFLECGKDKVLRVPERLMLREGTSINEFSVDGTLSGNSTFAVPTEKAVKTYVDKKISAVNDFTGHGKQKLIKGSNLHTISFDESLESDDYVINISIVNTDSSPKFYSWVVTSLTENGFSVAFSEKIASNNCEIHWTAIHN